MPRTPLPSAFAALAPTGAAKQALDKKNAAKELEVKKRKAAAAAVRKKEREAEKARVAEVDEALAERKRQRHVEREVARHREAAPAAPAAAPALTAEDDDGCDETARFGVDVVHYVSRDPPYLGESDFEDRETLRNTLGAKWVASEKLWGAPNVSVLAALLKSQLWTPLGLGDVGCTQLQGLLASRERKARAKAEAEAERRRILEAEEQRKADQLAEARRLDAERRAAAAAKEEEERAEALRNRTNALPPEPDEVAAMRAFGVDADTVLKSAAWDSLGPNFGISLEARILRYLDLLQPTVCRAAAVEELNAHARGGKVFVWNW